MAGLLECTRAAVPALPGCSLHAAAVECLSVASLDFVELFTFSKLFLCCNMAVCLLVACGPHIQWMHVCLAPTWHQFLLTCARRLFVTPEAELLVCHLKDLFTWRCDANVWSQLIYYSVVQAVSPTIGRQDVVRPLVASQ